MVTDHDAIIAIVDPARIEPVLDAAGKLGLKGATLLTGARGQGRIPMRTFFGLALDSRREILLFLAPKDRAGELMEAINQAGSLDELGAGIAFRFDLLQVAGLGRDHPQASP